VSNLGTWFKNVFQRKTHGSVDLPEAAESRGEIPAAAVAPPEKTSAMNFEDILSTIQQIEEIVGPSDSGEEAVQLDAVHMPFTEMVKLVPDAFSALSKDLAGAESFDVLVQDLYGQLAKGKATTTLHYFLAGVPPRYLAVDDAQARDRTVSLPLPLLVRLIDPEQLKSRSATRKAPPSAAHIPDLFVATPKDSVVPEATAKAKVETPIRPGILLPLGELARMIPESFRLPAGMTAYPSVKVKVDIDDLFGKLAAGKVEVKRFDCLINVPSQFLAPTSGGSSDNLVSLSLSAVVSAIPPEEWQKRMSSSQAPVQVSHIPDLFEARPAPKAAIEPAPEPLAVEEEAPAAASPVVEPEPEVEGPSVELAGEEGEGIALEPVDMPMEPEPALPALEEELVSEPIEPPVPTAEIAMPMVEEPPAGETQEVEPEEEPVVEPEKEAPAAESKVLEPPKAKPVRDAETVLNQVMGRDAARRPDFAEVASRFKELGGFEGCAIIHREGDLLATSWEHKATDMLEVISPQICKRVAGYVEHLDEGAMKSVTVSVAGHLLTFAQEGELCFVAVHRQEDFDLEHLAWTQWVAGELGRRYGAAH